MPNMPLNIQKEDFQILLAEDDNATRQLLQVFVWSAKAIRSSPLPMGRKPCKPLPPTQWTWCCWMWLMPVLDGWAVCSELRKRTDVPIMMLTGHNSPEDVVRGINLGADSYVAKPFTLKEVRARVQAVLRRAAQKQHRNVTQDAHLWQHRHQRADP